MLTNIKDEIKWLQRRVDENPHSILFARLAERYVQETDYDHAIKICKKGLEKHPEYPTGHLVLAKCYFKMNEMNSAEQELKKVLELDNKYLLAYKLYGDLMSVLGWTNAAEESYNKIQKIDPFEKNAMTPFEGFDVENASPPAPPVDRNTPNFDEPEIGIEINEDSIDNLFSDNTDSEVENNTFGSIFGGEENESKIKTDPVSHITNSTKHTDLSDETVEALFNVDEETDDFFSPERLSDDSEFSFGKETMYTDDTVESLFEDTANPTSKISFDNSPKQTFIPPIMDEEDEDKDASLSLFSDEAESDSYSSQPGIFEQETSSNIFEQEKDTAFTPQAFDSDALDKEFPIIEDDTDFSMEKFKEEDDRFSNILDGIFSPNLDEDERGETGRNRSNKTPVVDDTSLEEAEDSLLGLHNDFEQDEEAVEPEIVENIPEFKQDIFNESDDLELDEFPFDENPFVDELSLSSDEMIFNNIDKSEPLPGPKQETYSEPEIPEGFLAFEDDESADDFNVSSLDNQVFDHDFENFDEDEEELGNFLAGLGGDEHEGLVHDEDMYNSLIEPEMPEEVKPKPEMRTEPSPSRPVIIDNDEPGEKPKEKFVTPTLGEIYAAQGQYSKAINVFEMLLEKSPDNEWYKTKLAYLKNKLEEESN